MLCSLFSILCGLSSLERQFTFDSTPSQFSLVTAMDLHWIQRLLYPRTIQLRLFAFQVGNVYDERVLGRLTNM